MDKQELIDQLKDAQEHLFQAAEIMRDVAREEGGNAWAEHYIIAPVEIAASKESIWHSRDANIDEWIAKLNGAEQTE